MQTDPEGWGWMTYAMVALSFGNVAVWTVALKLIGS